VTDHNPLADIVARLDPAEVAQQMVESFRSEIAGYRRLPNPVIAKQIFDVARRNVELCFDSIAAGVSPTRAELEPFMASARDRASEGMPLEDLLHAYRLGGRLGWQAIVKVALPEEQSSLIAAAALVMRYIDDVSAAVAQAYLEERQQVVSEEERATRDLFEAIIRDAALDRRLEALAQHRGFALLDAYHPFVVRSPGSGSRRHADLASALRRDGILALTEGDRVGGLLTPEQQPLVAGLPGLHVVGDPIPRSELSHAMDEVRTVAELAEANEMTGSVDPRDFLLELLLLAAPRHASAISRRTLSPLQNGDRARSAELLATLDAFVGQDLDRRGTAERLHIHPNTLDYRLRQIRELTGLDPRNAQHVALLVLALKQQLLKSR
jgi:PucR-like helix-turn-helix protein